MKILRLFLGIFVGLMAITLIAESIEFATVKTLSGHSFEFLKNNQDVYFKTRNQFSVIVFKLVYNLFAAAAGGYVMAWIAKSQHKIALCALIAIQTISFVWGGFFSEFSETAPTWLWVALIVLTALGIYLGHNFRIKQESVDSAAKQPQEACG